MNIVFRVDSSIQIGSGHLMRCLTLADELAREGNSIVFICKELKGNLIQSIKLPVISLPINKRFYSESLHLSRPYSIQVEDAKQTIEAISDDIDLLIVDSYALDKVWHQELRPYTKKIMVIDDLANKSFDCDILLNQNAGSERLGYRDRVPKGCCLLLGLQYAMLRPEFLALRKRALAKRKKTQDIKNILVSMGGSDKKNVSYDILQRLSSRFNVVVVLGLASVHKQMIVNYAKSKNIKVIINADNMSELMLNADLSIGAGGSTSWERCCLGLPTLIYVLSENQKEIARELEQFGAAMLVRNLEHDLKALTSNLDIWKLMSDKSQSMCDGLGVKRISRVLMSGKKDKRNDFEEEV